MGGEGHRDALLGVVPRASSLKQLQVNSRAWPLHFVDGMWSVLGENRGTASSLRLVKGRVEGQPPYDDPNPLVHIAAERWEVGCC